jgi:hypothetical protein
MADLMPFYVMTELQAARFRELTAGEENRLDPRKVEAGPYAGKYVLPKRIRYAEEFQSHWDAFDMLTEVAIDRDVAWPPTEDELAARRAQAE